MRGGLWASQGLLLKVYLVKCSECGLLVRLCLSGLRLDLGDGLYLGVSDLRVFVGYLQWVCVFDFC